MAKTAGVNTMRPFVDGEVSRIREYLLSFNVFAGAGVEEQGVDYLNDHLQRLLLTLEMLPKPTFKGARLLELGAFPYYMTVLLYEYTDYEVTVANFFAEPSEQWIREIKTLKSVQFCKDYPLEYCNFNVERERFPYRDAEFDLVLCAELIEHLVLDPTHMLCEVHRVLKDGGYLVLTTPNVLRWQNGVTFLRSGSIYDHYSGYGVYGRHNREYTISEVRELVKGCGFEIVGDLAADVHRVPVLIRALRRLVRWMEADQILLVAKAAGEGVHYYPTSLYKSMEKVVRPTDSQIIMGKNDALHLERGWYPLDDLPPSVRWTKKAAKAYLRKPRARSLSVQASSGPVALGQTIVTLTVGSAAARFALLSDRWQELRLDLPCPLPDVVELDIVVEKTRNPAALGLSRDNRDLGVMVRRISLH